MAVVARFGTHDGVKGGNGAQNPAVTVNPAEYPLTDPVFQNFTAQQNLTLGTAGAASTYSEVAPVEPSEEVTKPETNAQRKARLRRELAALKAKNEAELTEAERARMLVVEAALKNGKTK